ncbi:hypothetical protein AVEN_5678-1 [Araneus ventricosus]|uniref:Uncharacterized protein n=1 Tax=Araneus ventricosus TaxID=182803 RepID=A0A4Y2DTH2_ARAVE|nr:hypothetical protein AVEN_5678-1 [Araneus ventricosus]
MEVKSNRQGRKPMEFGTNDWKRWDSNELKIQDFTPDSSMRPRCEARGTSKDLPRLGPLDEARKSESRVGGGIGDRRVTVAHFGAYVNDVHNFSIKMGGEKIGLRINGLQVNAQLY